MKSVFVLLVLVLITMQGLVTVYAQNVQRDIPASWRYSLADPPVFQTMPAIDLRRLEVEDSIRELQNIAPRFGYKHLINFSPTNSGVWQEDPTGAKVWQLRLRCSGAISLNLLFQSYHLQPGSQLFVYSPQSRQLLGPFTDFDNRGTFETPKGYGTGFIYGEELVVELNVPAQTETGDILELKSVTQAYRMIRVPKRYRTLEHGKTQMSFMASGECQVNVNCPDGDDWQAQKKGVALMIMGGEASCTGTLINNTCNDATPYFLTASHCLYNSQPKTSEDPPPPPDPYRDFAFQWNYESDDCETPFDEPDWDYTIGAEVIAQDGIGSPIDFGLLQLEANPIQQSPPIDVYFNGWDLTEDPPNGGAGIHHPRGDIKKISLYTQKPVSNGPCNFMDDGWVVSFLHPSGHRSVSEPGSSGSPLFSKDKKIIGDLRGSVKGTSCTADNDCLDIPIQERVVYCKFSVAWDYSLKYWLDPCAQHPTSWPGGSYNACTEPNIQVAGTISNYRLYHAEDWISSNATITNTANVRMWAEDYIELTNGFDAQSGSAFVAEIKPCITSVRSAKKSSPATFRNRVSIESKSEIVLFPNPIVSGAVLQAVYFNPVVSASTITFYDMQGCLVSTSPVEPGQQVLKLNTSLMPGAYRWRVTAQGVSLDNGTLVVR